MENEIGSLVNMLAIDPGTNCMGLCYMTLNIKTLEVISTRAETIMVKTSLLNKDTILFYSERQAKLDYLTNRLTTIVSEFKPITIACEGPFYNGRRPGAFAPLLELLLQFKLALRDLYPLVGFVIYEPSTVKRGVDAKGNADKDQIRSKVLVMKDIMKYNSPIPIEELDEHSIDSIAVAFTHVNNLRVNLTPFDNKACLKF